MKWTVEFIKEAQKDLKRLDPYNQKIYSRRYPRPQNVPCRRLTVSESRLEITLRQI